MRLARPSKFTGIPLKVKETNISTKHRLKNLNWWEASWLCTSMAEGLNKVYRKTTPAKWSERDLNQVSGGLQISSPVPYPLCKFVTWGQRENDNPPISGQRFSARTINELNSFICTCLGSCLLKIMNTRRNNTQDVAQHISLMVLKCRRQHERNDVKTLCTEQRDNLV